MLKDQIAAFLKEHTKEVNENVKAANSCLRKAKWQAKELAVFTGEVVRLMDKVPTPMHVGRDLLLRVLLPTETTTETDKVPTLLAYILM